MKKVSGSTDTEVVEVHKPKSKKVKRVSKQISGSTSTEEVEIVRPRKHKKVIREVHDDDDDTVETIVKKLKGKREGSPKKHKKTIIYQK